MKIAAIIVTLLIATEAAGIWLFFHGPDDSLIAIEKTNAPWIVRRAPPGMRGKTQIITGEGSVVVKESMCDVLHSVERRCAHDKP